MRFVLKWILQKHVGIHEEKNNSNMKYCHHCHHEISPQCRYIGKCSKTLCPFKHNHKADQSISDKSNSSVEVTEDLVNEKPIENIEDEEVFNL